MKQNRLLSIGIFCILFCMASCKKEYSFERGAAVTADTTHLPPPPAPTVSGEMGVNTWQFTDNTNGSIHKGIIDTLNTSFEINQLWNYLQIKGWPISSGTVIHDTLFLVSLFLPTPVIETGTYSILAGVGGDNFCGYANRAFVPPYGSNQNFCYYIATPSIAPAFTIKIISYDRQQKLLKGNFFGTILRRANINDYGGNNHNISGSFYARMN